MATTHKSSKLVPALANVFSCLREGTPMALIQRVIPYTRDNDPFIDRYVILFPILPFVFIALYNLQLIRCLTWIIGIWRIFEVIVFLSNTYLFDDYRLKIQGKEPKPFGGIRRVLILTAVNYFELILWFAAFYRVLLTFPILVSMLLSNRSTSASWLCLPLEHQIFNHLTGVSLSLLWSSQLSGWLWH